MTGIPVILGADRMPYRVMVQIPGEAMQVRRDVLRDEFERGGRLQRLLPRYTQALFVRLTHSAVCNRFHTFQQRPARWLLMSRERVQIALNKPCWRITLTCVREILEGKDQ